ncbi:MAG: adenylosuccinate lyase family protein [Pigmentiphaga sp.]|nr:adenylosuccinate lyase family protein [Pigmentiphaga sp.]
MSDIARIFSTRSTLERHLDFEKALAQEQAALGMIPEAAARHIQDVLHVDALDLDALFEATQKTGFAIAPLVRQAHRLCGEAGEYFHWGATTQDVLISTRASQINDSLPLLAQQLKGVIKRLAELAKTYRDLPMAGRGFGGHALPITLGLKCANWLSSQLRLSRRLRDLMQTPIEGELCGAMGTLAAFGEQGRALQQRVLLRFGLPEQLTTASSARDAVAGVTQFLALLTASWSKIAHDIATLCSTEIGELDEPVSGAKDTSSTLPHKSNPTYCWQVMSAATLVQQHAATMLYAMGQEQERSGQGLLEAQCVPQAFIETERAVLKLRTVLEGLTVHPARITANLALTRGLVCSEAVQMALAPVLGRLQAHDLVHEVCQQAASAGLSLADALKADARITPHLDSGRIERLTDPSHYLGQAADIVKRVVAAAEAEQRQLTAALKHGGGLA